MSDSIDRESPPPSARHLDLRWRFLGTLDRGSMELVAEPVGILAGIADPLLAITQDGQRVLLVPAPLDATVPSGLSGASLKLSMANWVVKGQSMHFLQVTCTRPDLYDKFAVIAEQIVEAVAAGELPVPGSIAVIAKLRDLLRLPGEGVSREFLAGLYCELIVLEQLLEMDPTLDIGCWRGPYGERHDFRRGSEALEVKSTMSNGGMKAHISGIDQLLAPEGGTLTLAWFRVEVVVKAGETVRQAANAVRSRLLNPAQLDAAWSAMKFDPEMEEAASTTHFAIRDSRMFPVSNALPRITSEQLVAAALMRGIVSLEYEIDLAVVGGTELSTDVRASILAKIAGAGEG